MPPEKPHDGWPGIRRRMPAGHSITGSLVQDIGRVGVRTGVPVLPDGLALELDRVHGAPVDA